MARSDLKIPKHMNAMVLLETGSQLIVKTVSTPTPGEHQILVKVMACGVCRTDLHIIDGELPRPAFPLILGHEIIGKVVSKGPLALRFKLGDIVGIPWLAFACGKCKPCLSGNENLCDYPLFTGYSVNGGFAEYTTAFEAFCFQLPPLFCNPAAAPLMCAGLIGYRSYRQITPSAEKIGIYGFGAAAHILIQIANYQGKQIYAFTRPGDLNTQNFARQLGARWAGDSNFPSPDKLDAAIIFAPIGDLIPVALANTSKGGIVVCGGIHMTDIPSFPYRLLWEERSVKSVANLTREDGEEFLKTAVSVPMATRVNLYPLLRANEAISDLREGKVEGAAVLLTSMTN